MVELFRNPRRLLLFLFEGALVAVLVAVAACLRFGDIHRGLTYPDIAKKAVLFAIVVQGASYYAGMYDPAATRSARAVYERVLKALALGSVILRVFFSLGPRFELGRGIYLGMIPPLSGQILGAKDNVAHEALAA